MRPFSFVEPRTIEEALLVLRDPNAKARALAGGIDLLGELKDDLVEAEALVNLKALPGLDTVRADADGALRIGALVTLTALAAHDKVRRDYPAVAQAAFSVGSPEIRNVGTVGGNLCQRPRCWYYRSAAHRCLKKGGDVCFTLTGDSRYHAILGGGPSFIVHPSDLAPALIAADARVTIAGPGGARALPLQKFYVLPEVRLDHETILKPGEVVTEITLPGPSAAAAGWKSRFEKFKEKDSMDFALASVAAAVKIRNGVVAEARLVLGGVAPVPWRSPEGERAILRQKIDDDIAMRAAEAALAAASPLAHNGYKIPLAKALVRATLLELR